MKLPVFLRRVIHTVLLAFSLALLLSAPGENASAQAPNGILSFTVSNPVCQQARSNTGACTILIRNINASSSASDFERITISIDGKLRANLQGFFESSGYVYGSMLGNGLQVSCGGKGAGGDPNYGNRYSVQIQANLYGNSPSTDIASVYCPYYEGKVYLPGVVR